MATNYSTHVNTKKTPQTEFIPGRKKDQKKNSGGGVSFSLDKWLQLDRFLILGTAGGTYYSSERKLTVDNATVIYDLLTEDGQRVLDRIVEVSKRGLAPKNDPAIFALALVCTCTDDTVRLAAYRAITQVCRTGTHLFAFCQAIQDIRNKWPRGLRNGVARFYENRTPEKIALQMMKYRSRKQGGGAWTHQDVIRLSHPQFPKGADGLALRVLGKNVREKDIPAAWMAFEAVQTFKEKSDIKKLVKQIELHDLPWEAVPTEMHQYREVWEALLPRMGYTALLRNLSRFAKLGIIPAHGFDASTKLIASRFADREELKKSRLHPLTILNGMKAYGLGHSMRPSHGNVTNWDVSQKILDILDGAFYAAFENVEPTGKRYLLGLDVSGSMDTPISDKMAIRCHEAVAALAMVTMRSEPETYTFGFSTTFKKLDFTKKDRIDDVLRKMSNHAWAATDCAVPMTHALKHKIPVDVFTIYTDNETNYGTIHPSQALEQYRQKMGIDAKMVVVGMTATGFTIADPKDPRQLDVVGFSTDTPQAISAFVGTEEAQVG